MLPRPATRRATRARAFAACSPLLLSAILALPGIGDPAWAGEAPDVEPSLVRSLPGGRATAAVSGAVANASCAGAACDTVWIGHKAGTFNGVAVGGVWDFDTDVAGTDSSQGMRRWAFPYASGILTVPATDRPDWGYDWGNEIDAGNTSLWQARDLAGRVYVRTGVVGAWHSDPMTNMRKNNNPLTNGGEASSLPIDGLRSAWCGLRASGDQTAQDALTGNYLNADLWAASQSTPSSFNGDWPGYASLWDQMLYKDFPSAGSGTLTARLRTDLVDFVDNSTATGTGWYNPDPTTLANFVNNPSDSFMVYVGSPNENAYDTNRRWFSEVLDFGKPVQELFRTSGRVPVTGLGDTLLTLPYAGLQPVSGSVRVVFRIKTNRVRSDATTGTSGGPNTKEGAALLDDVQVDGGTVYGFETAGSVTARSLIPDLSADGGAWATTGRPPGCYFHIENISTLLYEDLCGGVDSPVRLCDLRGNVVVAGDHDDGNRVHIESRQMWATPTINLAVRNAAPGTKNDQGIDQQAAARPTIDLDYDIYTGFMGLDQAIFWQFGGRFFGPTSFEPVSTNLRCWSPWQIYPGLVYQPDPYCQRGSNGNSADNISSLGIPGGQIDSLQAMVETISQGWRFGGTELGNTRGTYFDNLRVGLIRPSSFDDGQLAWEKFQDQFPVNEAVPPADNTAFDTTTAYVRTGLNIVVPISGPGYVAGDSMLFQAAYAGDGVTTGTRLDLVFRIAPGPGNYTVEGDRGSALVEKDPAHPFWAAYLADNGAFGSGGNGVSGPGHGAVWNQDLWNSCRMDSAELNLWPVVARGIGGPTPPSWMGTIHEQDPKFATLGIDHLACFLANPAGPVDVTNTDCGTPGASPPSAGYGAATRASWGTAFLDANAVRKEGTKIIPDGYLCPGTHVEYFVRRSSIEAPGVATLFFDTARVVPQGAGVAQDLDQERWSSFNVLPDLWKSTRFGGAGLSCLLLIDGADRRGADPAYRGAADSLGYGRNDGAAQGWRTVDFAPPDPTQTTGRGPNNPAGFVAANLGQYGLAYDHYDIRGAEAGGCGHPGARLASVQSPGNVDPRRTDRSGPSPAMLATFYNTILLGSGDLDQFTMDDKAFPQQQADDVGLYASFLEGASSGNLRGMWVSGDNVSEESSFFSGRALIDLLIPDFGSDLAFAAYKARSGTTRTVTGLLPTASWAHPGRVYGFQNDCTVRADVLALQGTVTGATEAAQYESFAGPGPWTASIYRPVDAGAGRWFRTLIDGFSLGRVLADYATLGEVATVPRSNDVGRLAWFDDVLTNHFAICARRGPVIGVGDLPGTDGARFADANLGAYPNPARAARPVTLRFTLARAQAVTVRLYTVAGREVARFTRQAQAGENAFVWDGRLANGARATPGVYFYSLSGDGLPAGALPASRLVLLSAR